MMGYVVALARPEWREEEREIELMKAER